MQITAKAWNNYITKMSRISATAAKKMQEYVTAHGFDDMKAILNYAFALSNHYGKAIGALSCQMYDATAAAQGVMVPSAEIAPLPEYGDVAKVVYGAKKTSENEVSRAIGRIVKQVGADTTLRNAKRDGAQFAWVPHGDTCAFCLTLASRGWQNISKKALKNGHAEHIHANCDCQYAVRFDGKSTVKGYNPDKYKKMYDSAEGNTPQEKINSMRRSLYAQNSKRSLPKQLKYMYNGAENFIPQNAEIEARKIIAGRESNTILNDAPRLAATYKAAEEDFSKHTGIIESDKFTFEIHWYEDTKGNGYEHKIKGIKEK